MRLRYARRAAAEVETLLAYVAERSPQGARHVRACLQSAEQTLIEHPKIGQLTNARLPAVRRFVLRPYPYVLFYEANDTEILVIGVRHGARDPSLMPGEHNRL